MKSMLELIFSDSPELRCAIWLCMYWRKVRPDHLPIFIIVVSSEPVSLRAMAPPARSECAPTKSASIPLSCKSSVLTVCRMLVIICLLVIWVQRFDFLSQTSQSRFIDVPLLARM